MQNILHSVDQFAGKIKPLNSLIECLVTLVVPGNLAQACTCAYFCYNTCAGSCRYGLDVRQYHVRACGSAARDCFADTVHYCYGSCGC